MAFTDFIRNFHEKHEKLKHTIHNKWRYPLPKSGQYAMAFFYFCIPIVGGHYVMEWAKSKSVDEIGPRGEKLREKTLQGFGDKTVIDGRVESVGAGGSECGVRQARCASRVRVRVEAVLPRAVVDVFALERARVYRTGAPPNVLALHDGAFLPAESKLRIAVLQGGGASNGRVAGGAGVGAATALFR